MRKNIRNMQVLVVDERLVADTLVLILERAGVRAKAAYSSRQAMALMHAFDPDALIADSMLEGMNGFELARQIVRAYPHCKTLLFSEQPPWNEEPASYGFSTVAKPVNPRVILEWLGCAAPSWPQPAGQAAGIAQDSAHLLGRY